jgi:DHA2 family multidrug resistance protein
MAPHKTQADPHAHQPPPSLPTRLTRTAAIGIGAAVVGAIMANLNSSLTAFSSPDLQGAFGTGHDQGSWISTSYDAAEVAAIPTCRWIAATVSVRRFIIVNASLFTLFCLLVPFATTPEQLFVLRVLQGLTGGVLTPMTLMCVLRFMPMQSRIWGVALYAFSSTFSPSIAAAIDGIVTETFGWQWLYWLFLLPGLLVVTGAMYGLPREPFNRRLLHHADWFGVIVAGPGIAMLAVAVDQGDRLDWFNSGLITGLFIGGGLLVAAFLINEPFQRNPLYNLALLTRVNFTIPLLVLVAFRFALLASVSITPQYLSRIQNLRPLQSGDVLLLVALPQLVLPVVVVLVLRWIDARLVMGFGLGTMAVGCLLNIGITNQWAYPDFVVPALVQALAEPFIIIPLLVLALGTVKPTEGNWAGAMVNDLRSFGGTLGSGLVTTILRHREQFHSNIITQTVVAGSGSTTDRLNLLGHGPIGAIGAVRSLAATVQREAYVMAYADAFIVLAVIMLCMLVLTAVLKPPARPGTPPGAA